MEFSFFSTSKEDNSPEVSVWGETGTVKRVTSQILFLWFLHRLSNGMHSIEILLEKNNYDGIIKKIY